MYRVILGLDLSTKTGWTVRKKDAGYVSGVEHFRVGTRESKGMVFVKFGRWLTMMVLKYDVDLIVYEMPHHQGGAATNLLIGLATEIKKVHSHLLDLAQKKEEYLSTLTEFEREVLTDSVANVQRHGFEVKGWDGKTFEYTTVVSGTVKAFVKDFLKWQKRGLTKAEREQMSSAEIEAHNKAPLIAFFKKLRKKAPATSDEADAFGIVKWAEVEYAIDEGVADDDE